MNRLLKLLNCRTLSVLRINTIQIKNPVFRDTEFPQNSRFICSPNGNFRSLSSKTANAFGSPSVPLAQLKNKLQLTYTCKICNTRSMELISKVAYNQGVVIVRCRGCASTHLIADNLSWFANPNKTIQDILREKGEKVIKIGSGKNTEFILTD